MKSPKINSTNECDLAIERVQTAPQKAMDCRSSLNGLNQVYGPNRPTPSAQSICGIYINIFTRRTIRNQFDMLLTAVADVRKGQTDMPYQGEHQTLIKQHVRHQVYPCDIYCTSISISVITILIFSMGRSNSGIADYVRI